MYKILSVIMLSCLSYGQVSTGTSATPWSQCHQSNPYKETPGIPDGPIYCPDGVIDWDCVREAQNRYLDAVEEATAKAYSAYRSACYTEYYAIQDCAQELGDCFDSGLPTDVCEANFTACTDEASQDRSEQEQQIEQAYQDTVQAAVDQYWSDVALCCIFFSATMGFGGNDVCGENPYRNGFYIPMGPEYCDGVLDWNCVAEAYERYRAAMQLLYNIAAYDFDRHCEIFEDAVDNCFNLYYDCVGTTGDMSGCAASTLDPCIRTQRELYNLGIAAVDSYVQDRQNDLLTLLYSDLADCCIR